MKWSNIFLSDGDDGTKNIKLGDLGLSRIKASQMTSGVGTVGYMSPEIVLSEKYSYETDIW